MRRLVVLLLAVVTAPCAGAVEPTAGERVLETFQVGDHVYVRALYLDAKAGTLWVGTSLGAHEIDLATARPRKTFTRADGLANESVFAIAQDRAGYTWFGTNAGGASRYKDGKWQTYFPMHGLADYWVYAFASDKAGDMWIGTWAGASRFNIKTGKFTNYARQLANPWVSGIGVDRAGRIWFGTEGGVTMFDGKDWRSWTHKDGVGAPDASTAASASAGPGTHRQPRVPGEGSPSQHPNYVFSILVAGDDSVWAGTWGGGVSHFDGARWTSLTTRDGLAGNIVYSMASDARGVLWFGTNNGVSRFDGHDWRHYGRPQGLLEDNVYALAVAPGGDVWAGTKRGVARIGTR